MASYNKKEHLRANIEAIKTVFALHREQRTATPEERTVLEAYTGFGALKCILSPANSDLFHRAMSSIVFAGERIHFNAPKPV